MASPRRRRTTLVMAGQRGTLCYCEAPQARRCSGRPGSPPTSPGGNAPSARSDSDDRRAHSSNARLPGRLSAEGARRSAPCRRAGQHQGVRVARHMSVTSTGPGSTSSGVTASGTVVNGDHAAGPPGEDTAGRLLGLLSVLPVLVAMAWLLVGLPLLLA